MSAGSFRTADGSLLAYVDEGDGLPVLWQHGLGADRNQPAEVFPTLGGVRRITLECRGHGQSELGDEAKLSIAQFTDDVVALLDHVGIEQAIVGGISLGAAIALRIAALHAERASGLVLARPAWVDEHGPEHLRIYRDVADLLATYGLREGKVRFEALPRLAEVEAVSPDNAASMRWFFDRDNPRSTIALLSRIPAEGPGISRHCMRTLALPTLVIGNDHDYVHTLTTAREVASLIPGATVCEITSKTIDRARYVADFKDALSRFLTSRKGTP
jgi:pimeloyl-ACP methyl ester carboxylesterase